MDGYSPSSRNKSRYFFTGERITAFGPVKHNVVNALDRDPPALFLLLRLFFCGRGGFVRLFRFRQKFFDNLVNGQPSISYRNTQVFMCFNFIWFYNLKNVPGLGK
jgi:hypothetical protein